MAEKQRTLTVNLHRRASDRLNEIWLWNSEKWGKAHADRYASFLREQTLLLASTYPKDRAVPGRLQYRYRVLQQKVRRNGHVVVYELRPHEILVLEFYHTAQDWPRRASLLRDDD